MAIFGVSLTSTIESLAYSKKRCKRSIQSDIDGIAAMNLVTTWAVSRIEDISKELIRQSEHGTIKAWERAQWVSRSLHVLFWVRKWMPAAAQLGLYQATKITG